MRLCKRECESEISKLTNVNFVKSDFGDLMILQICILRFCVNALLRFAIKRIP